MSFFSQSDPTPAPPAAEQPTAPPPENAPAAPDQPVPQAPPAQDAPQPPSAPPAPAAPPEAPAPAAPPSQPQPEPQPSSPAGSDVEAQLAQMRAQIEVLTQKASTGQLTRAPVDEELAAKVSELRHEFENWPQPGERFAQAPQPFELQKLGLPQPGVNRDHLPPGEPDTISPVVVKHSQPTIGPGSAGQPVSLLAGLLGKLGYPTTISRGQNHSFSFDESVAHAVDAFKRDWHVIEDSSGFRTAEEAARVAGPWVWEALLRATSAAAKAA